MYLSRDKAAPADNFRHAGRDAYNCIGFQSHLLAINSHFTILLDIENEENLGLIVDHNQNTTTNV